MDASYRDDSSLMTTFAGYRSLGIDNDTQSVTETIAAIRRAIPEIYGP